MNIADFLLIAAAGLAVFTLAKNTLHIKRFRDMITVRRVLIVVCLATAIWAPTSPLVLIQAGSLNAGMLTFGAGVLLTIVISIYELMRG